MPTGACGGSIFDVTVTEVEEVHPVLVLVISRVYVPGAFMVGVRVFCPETKLPPTVDQFSMKLGPDEEVVASRFVCGNVQFNCAGGDMTVMGGGSWVTTTDAVFVQKLAPDTTTE